MGDASTFNMRIVRFGLSEKEARLYLHLLKYGSKPSTLLAKSLKTYREDIYRTLGSLTEKGMVNPSLDSPTVYAAVDIKTALDTTLKKHENELLEMEMTKQELQELSRQQRFLPSNEFPTYKILKTVKDVFSSTVRVFESAVYDIMFIIPAYALSIASRYGDHGNVEKASQRGVRLRGITDISYANLDTVREYADLYADFGYELRNYYQYHGLFFLVSDGKENLSMINAISRAFHSMKPS